MEALEQTTSVGSINHRLGETSTTNTATGGSHEKVHGCCCGIFSKLWENRHVICLGLGAASMIAAISQLDIIIGIIALKFLVIACCGIYNTHEVNETEKEFKASIKPALTDLIGTITPWLSKVNGMMSNEKKVMDVTTADSFMEVKELYDTVVPKIEALNNIFKNCQSRKLRNMQVNGNSYALADAKRFLAHIEDMSKPIRNMERNKILFQASIYTFLASVKNSAESLMRLMPEYLKVAKERDNLL